MFDKLTLTNLAKLGYSQTWLDSGILTEADLAKQIAELATGEDPNTEHYRYKVFCAFIDKIDNLDNKLLQQILKILKSDNDQAMSSSATIHLLKKHYLTNNQFDIIALHLQTLGDWTEKHIDKIKNSRLN